MEVTLAIITALLALTGAQDIAFPSEDKSEVPAKKPPQLSDNMLPLDIPGRCPPNQLLYPIPQKDDWICDCGPGFLYYPPKKGCYRAYRQGPCDPKKYLILPKHTIVAECQDNPCETDGFVQYKGKCYELDKSGGPCKPGSEGGGVFSVNTTTLALECLSLENPDGLSIINFPSNCPPGGKRGANHCRIEY